MTHESSQPDETPEGERPADPTRSRGADLAARVFLGYLQRTYPGTAWRRVRDDEEERP